MPAPENCSQPPKELHLVSGHFYVVKGLGKVLHKAQVGEGSGKLAVFHQQSASRSGAGDYSFPGVQHREAMEARDQDSCRVLAIMSSSMALPASTTKMAWLGAAMPGAADPWRRYLAPQHFRYPDILPE